MTKSKRTDYFKEFETYLRGQDRADKTIHEYGQDVRVFAAWLKETRDEEFSPRAITPTDVREFRAHLLNVKRQAPATINRRLTALRIFCRWARLEKWIETDPLEGIKLVKEVKPAPRWLDRKEQYALRRIVEKEGDLRNLAIIVLMLNTGLRISEVAGLKLDDVELSERKGQITVRGKGTKVRTIPLNAEVRRALKNYLAKRPPAEHDAFFIGSRGEPLGTKGLDYQIRTLGRLANLEISAHDLRHTFAKSLVDQSVSLDQVAVLLGHRSLTTTARYTQPSQQDLARAVEKIGADG